MSKLKLFLVSLTLTTCGLLALIYVIRAKNAPKSAPELHQIADGLFITAQLKPDDIRSLKKRGIRTIIDIRPDGEADDQAASWQIENATKIWHLEFFYIPVPHEDIPESAVDALNKTLTTEAKPALLYCRTGRRAVRAFALVEASKAGGPGAEAIQAMVANAGFNADDLTDKINERISRRAVNTSPTH